MAGSINCFQHVNGSILNESAFAGMNIPCMPLKNTHTVSLCCREGHTCYSNQFCGFQPTVPGESGWYIAGCTDPSWGSGCPSNCGYWQCCGDDSEGHANCGKPLLASFSAPAPQDLVSTYSLPGDLHDLQSWELWSTPSTQETTTLSEPSGPISVSHTAKSSISNPPAPSSVLSRAESAGIGISVGIAGILIGTAAILFLQVLQRRRRQTQEVREPNVERARAEAFGIPIVEMEHAPRITEMPEAQHFSQELHGDQGVPRNSKNLATELGRGQTPIERPPSKAQSQERKE
ncbi:hypothetical protein EV356DRAFT_571718 [Viridothelium virens]|uniref:Uncharacterized protein n=1 Tax=Viridothelium virens TaxID=1048519 RepID=A0A6A6GTL5_VIRVR|nr:hypothetical protein EV356DRAFT_571718 [Viridothelium virens]